MNTAAATLVPGILLLLATCLRPGAALRCWVCSSPDGGHCGDPFNSSSLLRTTECSPPQHRSHSAFMNSYQPTITPVCKKVKQIEHGMLMFVRSCGFESMAGEACGLADDDNHRRRSSRHHRDDVNLCESCREDGCNAAAPAFTLLATTLASAAAVALHALLA